MNFGGNKLAENSRSPPRVPEAGIIVEWRIEDFFFCGNLQGHPAEADDPHFLGLETIEKQHNHLP